VILFGFRGDEKLGEVKLRDAAAVELLQALGKVVSAVCPACADDQGVCFCRREYVSYIYLQALTQYVQFPRPAWPAQKTDISEVELQQLACLSKMLGV
jgi:hypothetical protein